MKSVQESTFQIAPIPISQIGNWLWASLIFLATLIISFYIFIQNQRDSISEKFISVEKQIIIINTDRARSEELFNIKVDNISQNVKEIKEILQQKR